MDAFRNLYWSLMTNAKFPNSYSHLIMLTRVCITMTAPSGLGLQCRDINDLNETVTILHVSNLTLGRLVWKQHNL